MKPKDAFLQQVELRLELMDEWISNGQIPWRIDAHGQQIRDKDGELVPDFAPTTLEAFCEWKPEDSSAASGPKPTRFRRVSRDTLNQHYHSDLRIRVDAKRKAVEACLTHQLEKFNKASVIAELESRVAMLERIVAAQQTESRVARLRLRELETTYRGRHNEQRRQIAQLKSDLQEEQAKVSAAQAAFAKVTKLQPVPKKGPEDD